MTELGVCQVRHNNMSCRNLAMATYSGACVHEHGHFGIPACDNCAELVMTGTWTCVPCRDAGHACPGLYKELMSLARWPQAIQDMFPLPPDVRDAYQEEQRSSEAQ